MKAAAGVDRRSMGFKDSDQHRRGRRHSDAVMVQCQERQRTRRSRGRRRGAGGAGHRGCQAAVRRQQPARALPCAAMPQEGWSCGAVSAGSVCSRVGNGATVENSGLGASDVHSGATDLWTAKAPHGQGPRRSARQQTRCSTTPTEGPQSSVLHAEVCPPDEAPLPCTCPWNR